MAAEVDERWSNKGWSIDTNGLRAVREFDVVNATDESDALAQLYTQKGVQFNSPHPYQAALLCGSINLYETLGPKFLRFRAEYGIPTGGAFVLKVDENPLFKPIRLNWESAVTPTVIDRDLDDIPVFNSAGDPFLNVDQGFIISKILTVYRYEPYFNLAMSNAYEETVNATPFLIGGMLIDAGQCCCRQIKPSTTYEATAPYIEMMYRFEIRVDDDDPFQYWTLDTGLNTFRGTVTKARICFPTTGGDFPTSEVALNTVGQPLDATLAAWDGHAAVDPVINPNLLDYYGIKTLSNGFALGFRVRDIMDFTALGFS